MKTQKHFFVSSVVQYCFLFISLFFSTNLLSAPQVPVDKPDMIEHTCCKGIIVDKNTGSPLAFANLNIVNTNISTMSNKDGIFTLKIPANVLKPRVLVKFIGYKNKELSYSSKDTSHSVIAMEPASYKLPDLVVTSQNPQNLVADMLNNTEDNYSLKPLKMDGFYREVIKRDNEIVTICEAFMDVLKEPVNSYRTDKIKIRKIRKNTDSNQSDFVNFRLKNGPYSALYMDIVKYSDRFISKDVMEKYQFSLEGSTLMNNKQFYIVNFKQKDGIDEPLYYGQLYIDANTFAVKSAVFNLNMENESEVYTMLVNKKPKGSIVTPQKATYRIDYIEKDGKWYYGYGRLDLVFNVNWKKKNLNSTYVSTVEMAAIDWKNFDKKHDQRIKNPLNSSKILVDRKAGFMDTNFWGALNILEPEKSVETAINKFHDELILKHQNVDKNLAER